jgi:uncharacterized lipoprotein YehR (DUF1307 family)
MYRSINEFFFSKHYMYDANNRFNLRIKNAKILNSFQDPIKADLRLKKALYYYALELLDKSSIAIQPIAIAFGNIYFRENSRLQAAEIEIDNIVKGNVYVAVIKEQTVVTLLLMPLTISNEDIAKKIYDHDGTTIKQLRDMDFKELSFNDKKRKTIVIDLDMSDVDFMNLYPVVTLKNNKITTASGLSKIELDEITNKKEVKKERTFSINAIPQEFKALVPNKEFVIYEGMEIYVPYPDGPKKKKIRKLIIDETGTSRKFSLEFENTLKPMILDLNTTFIISPKMSNDVYKKLLIGFNLDENTELDFQGPITKFNFYKLGKGGSKVNKLGVIIDPKMYF